VRRFFGAFALMCVGSLGVGAAFVLAGPTQSGAGITFCHGPPGQPTRWNLQTANAESLLSGTSHAGNAHFRNIIPPFVVIRDGVARHYPGRNMNTIFSGGFTGAQILANHCVLPTGTNPVITQTVTVTETETVHTTVTAPGTTVTLPGHTTTHVVTLTVTTPGHTVTVPGETTVITVPTLTTTTVTLPERTVTLPGETVTEKGQTVVLPPITVTVPGPTHTITGGTTTTVVTITTPDQTVGGNVKGPVRLVVTVTTPGRTVTVKRHVIRTVHTYTEREPKTVILKVVHCRCPTVRGKG